jgi:dipeptidase E
MRLYLSFFRLGGFAGRLVALSTGRRAALVPNALDVLPSDVRDAGLQRDISDLGQVGLEVSDVDLRHPNAAERLSGYEIVWVRGGNVFVLRRVLADTGTDQVLTDLIRGGRRPGGDRAWPAGSAVRSPCPVTRSPGNGCLRRSLGQVPGGGTSSLGPSRRRRARHRRQDNRTAAE